MSGTIAKKPNGRYYAATHYTDADGRRRQRSHGGYRTKTEAAAALRAIHVSMDKGTFVEPSRTTLGQFLLVMWLPSIQVSIRSSTLYSYRHNLEAHVIPHIGHLLLQRLTPTDLNLLYRRLLTAGRRNGDKGGLAPKTVRHIHTTIHKALADAVDAQLVPLNVASKAKPPKPSATKRKEMSTWTAPELRRFLEHVRHERLSAAWHLAGSTGMRRGEVAGLRWIDIDLDAGRVSVCQALVSVAYKVELSDTKTTKGTRVIDLDVYTVAALRQHKARQAAERLALGSAYTDSGLVFTREDGSPLHPAVLADLFQRHLKAAGLPRIRFHDLRHTHATHALRAGVPPKVISERLGHSTVAFTMDVYAHAIPGMGAEAAKAVADLLWGS